MPSCILFFLSFFLVYIVVVLPFMVKYWFSIVARVVAVFSLPSKFDIAAFLSKNRDKIPKEALTENNNCT